MLRLAGRRRDVGEIASGWAWSLERRERCGVLAAGREASDAGGEWRAVAAVLRRLGLWWLVRRGLVCVCVCVCVCERERKPVIEKYDGCRAAVERAHPQPPAQGEASVVATERQEARVVLAEQETGTGRWRCSAAVEYAV